MLQEVVRNFCGSSIIVYILPEGTDSLPSLTVLHEHSDDYSLQCTEPVTLEGKWPFALPSACVLTQFPITLNADLTEFINKYGRKLNMEQFDEEYPCAM